MHFFIQPLAILIDRADQLELPDWGSISCDSGAAQGVLTLASIRWVNGAFSVTFQVRRVQNTLSTEPGNGEITRKKMIEVDKDESGF